MSEVIEGLVSTIIPVYNRPQMLREAVESVLAQTYRSIEIIISDDGSIDDTPQIISQLEQEYPDIIRAVHNSNQGAGPAREAGRQIARGEFIQYLDSDDLLRPRKFEIMVEALRKNPDCGAAYGYICLHPENEEPLEKPYKWTGRTYPTLFPWLLVDRWWNTNCPLFRRSVTDAVGPWSDLRWSQDWEYDGRVGALGTRLVHCKEFVTDQRQHSEMRQTAAADWTEPFRAKERKRFLGLLFEHAKAAGVTHDTPEMQHFSRWLFQTSRQCGAAGLTMDAAECFNWAKEAAGPVRARGRDFRIIGVFAAIFGWKVTGTLTHYIEQRLQKPPSNVTLKQSWMEKTE